MVVHKAAFSRWSLVRIGLSRQLVSHGPTEVADPSLRERCSVAPHSHLVEEGQSSCGKGPGGHSTLSPTSGPHPGPGG